MTGTNAGSPGGREPQGDTGLVVAVRVTPHQGRRETLRQGEGGQVMRIFSGLEACVMQSAETVVDVLRARGRRGLPCDELYRQLFNRKYSEIAWLPKSRIASTWANARPLTGLPNTYVQ